MTTLSVLLTLLMIMDPIGNSVNYTIVLKDVEKTRRSRIIFREIAIAYCILIAGMFFGKPLLTALKISDTALNISGGVVLFLISLKLIFPSKDGVFSNDSEEEPFVVPLATPFIAGPSSIAVIILMASSNPDKLLNISLGLTGAVLITLCCILTVNKLSKVIGEKIVGGLQRLTGMILTTISIQLLLTALDQYIKK